MDMAFLFHSIPHIINQHFANKREALRVRISAFIDDHGMNAPLLPLLLFALKIRSLAGRTDRSPHGSLN